jgi:hypothetical protein
MSNFKPRVFLHEVYGSVSRYDIRVILSILLFVYILFSFGQWQHNSSKHKESLGSLNILKQMQDYAKQHCEKTTNDPSSHHDIYLKVLEENKRGKVTKDTVDKEVTFILLGPTIRCLTSKVGLLKDRYKEAKIFVALNLGILTVNKQARIEESSSESYFLGGFTNIPEALNHAIRLVNTKYFMIIDHEMDLGNMQDNFVEVFLTNIPGYDILSGSIVDTLGEFSLPCQRLRMQYWSYYESYEYNISGNILQCDATSLYFIARHEAFKNLLHHNEHLFDANLTLKWTEDFFIRFKHILKVGVLPEIIIRLKTPKDCFNVELPVLTTAKQVELLLPFAKKHQLFYISNEVTHFDVCSDKSLACSEQGIQKKWGVRHWADAGLTTYPFIIDSLQKALHFGTKRLEESALTYVIEGGTVLGMVKLRDILPWDHGDIDTFVYSTRRKVINMVKESLHVYGYELWLRHTGFHTYVTDDPTSLNGCFVYLTRRLKPKGIIYMKHRGKLFPVKRNLFQFLRQFYGSLFLENHMKFSNQRSYCMTLGHHACMPDCRWDGCGGGLPGRARPSPPKR